MIDKIASSGERRCSHEDISSLQTIEALLISSINGKKLEDQDTLIKKSHQSILALQFSIINGTFERVAPVVENV